MSPLCQCLCAYVQGNTRVVLLLFLDPASSPQRTGTDAGENKLLHRPHYSYEYAEFWWRWSPVPILGLESRNGILIKGLLWTILLHQNVQILG